MSKKTSSKAVARFRRKRSIRKRISGSPQRPRLSVFRSARHTYAQVIDDDSGKTLASVSTRSKVGQTECSGKGKVEQAKWVGESIAKACLDQDIKQVAFDRNGFIYHGRIAAIADGAREAGLQF